MTRIFARRTPASAHCWRSPPPPRRRPPIPRRPPPGRQATATDQGEAAPTPKPPRRPKRRPRPKPRSRRCSSRGRRAGRYRSSTTARVDQRGINVFETTKAPGVEFTGFKLDIGASFTSQVQNLSHSNTAVPVDGAAASTPTSSSNIGFGFNNSTANLYLNAQLAPGIRVALTSYLSSRHHNETWVKDGYIQIDESPIDLVPLKMLFSIVTVRVGHMEINYGDAHFRRSDNGNAIYNPFVGNYIMDAFTTEIGGEVYLKTVERHRDGRDHRRRDSRHGDRPRPARPGASSASSGYDRQCQRGPPCPPHGLDVHDRQGGEQHALRRRPRRLALLLGAGEHAGDGERRRRSRASSTPASGTRSPRSRSTRS